jgi:hypothetical protein
MGIWVVSIIGGLFGILAGAGVLFIPGKSGEYMLLVTGSEHDANHAKILLERISHEVSMPIAV